MRDTVTDRAVVIACATLLLISRTCVTLRTNDTVCAIDVVIVRMNGFDLLVSTLMLIDWPMARVNAITFVSIAVAFIEAVILRVNASVLLNVTLAPIDDAVIRLNTIIRAITADID